MNSEDIIFEDIEKAFLKWYGNQNNSPMIEKLMFKAFVAGFKTGKNITNQTNE